MSTASDTLPPNATADQLPGNENDTDPSAKQPGHRAGTAKVAKAAQASSTATVPPPPPSSNKQGTAPAPGSNTLTNILGHYASTARPSTARIDPNAAPNSSPIALTIGNLWRYIPLVASAATSIGTAIASHAIYGPPKKSWGVEMTIFTRIMRDCGTQSEFATIAGLQQFFDLGSLLPVPKDGLITPVTFRVKKRNLRGFLKDADEGEDGKRELTGEWVVTKSTWKRLQSEWRSKSGGTTAAGMDKSNSNTSVTNNAEPASSSGTAQRSSSVPAQSKRSKDSEAAAAAPSSAAPNGKPTSAAVNGTNTSTSTSPPQKSTSISSSTSTSSSEPPPPTGAANGNANEKTSNGTANPSSSEFKRSDSVRGQPPRRERIIYYIHGGAYFVMSAATHRPLTISLSKYAECRVFAINYRLAPDTKFPGALHDCVSAWFRLVEDLGIPPKNIVLGADSAGGGLALALLCYLRDEKYELPAGAMLFSPWVDLTLSCDSWDTNSKYDYLPMPPSGSHMNPVHAYLGDDIEQYLTHPYVSPLFADMHGLPPLLIQCGDAEVLRDEGTLLAHKASLAGVSVRHELYEDCVHVFQAFLFLDASRKALQSARHFMRTALDRPPSSSSKPGRSRSTKAKKVTGSGSGKDGRKMSASSSSGAATAATAADPRRKLLAEEAAAGTGEDTGTETEGDEGSKSADAAAAAARLDAATRDRMDAEMRSGMGNVRGQRVEPSTGERERRHHHHHHHQSGRKSGAVGRVGAEAGSTAKVDSGPVASSGEKETKEAGPAEVSTSSGLSASDNDDDDDDDDGDEDEEFAYARTRKGSGAEKLSSAAAAFKAMQQRQQLRRTPSSTATTTNSSSLSNSTVAPPASSSSNSTTGVPSSGGVATAAAAAAEGGAENDAELLAAFHPPKSVLTPRMRQSSLVGLASSSEEAAAAGSAADGSVSGSAGLMMDGGADAGVSSSSASSVAGGGGEKDFPSSSTSPADASSISKSSASGSSIRPSFQLSKRNRSSAAISSLMESYAANPGVLRTNVWTPSGEGAGGSGNGAGAE
ncbi:hypothetical protein A4X13_0g2681 [Tilletia indica]|uniref:Alpha/beta hydrolase fold-3 domain-containing protein n=1 Tax=Tilletia indica TaxID=43049 RepID=A0A177TMW1_9BASI|nr:hypothetical protein A4X13_0g2681 [Tilletia indica]